MSKFSSMSRVPSVTTLALLNLPATAPAIAATGARVKAAGRERLSEEGPEAREREGGDR